MSMTLGDAILYLSADPKALDRDLKKADGRIKRFAKGAQNFLGKALKVGMIGAATGIAAGIGVLTKSVFEAADAGEAMAKFEATFGAAGDGLIDTLDEVAAATGRSRYELRESAANFGAVTKAIGFTEEAAAEMSAGALQMAVDIAAFNNLPTDDVAQRVQKALTGETESLKTLGIVVNQAAIEQELLNMGIEESAREVDQVTKAQAIYNIIQRQTADAQGIAAEEAGSFTGQMVALKAGFKDFMVEAGTQLLPILTPLLTKFNAFARDVLPQVVTWIQGRLVPALINIATFVTTRVIPAIQMMAQWFTTNIMPALQQFGQFVQTQVMPILAVLGNWILTQLVPALQQMFQWIGTNILPVVVALADVIGAALGVALTALAGLWENVLQPALEKASEWFGNLLEPIGGVSGAVQKLVDWLSDLADKIRNLELPDWLTPGSPTPFELGLKGINDQMKALTTGQLPQFAAELNAMGGSGQTTYDQRKTYNIGPVDARQETDFSSFVKRIRRL